MLTPPNFPPRLAGFWVNPEDGDELWVCRPREACLALESYEDIAAGVCGLDPDRPRYEGVGCSFCTKGFYRKTSTNKCHKCPSNMWVWYIIAAAGLILFTPLLVKLVQLHDGFGSINIIITFTQVAAECQRDIPGRPSIFSRCGW